MLAALLLGLLVYEYWTGYGLLRLRLLVYSIVCLTLRIESLILPAYLPTYLPTYLQPSLLLSPRTTYTYTYTYTHTHAPIYLSSHLSTPTPQTRKMRIPYAPTNPPLPPDSEESQIRSRIAARRHPRPLQALDLALLHAPPVADGWNAFLGAVRQRTTLDPRLRELAICRVAVCNRAWYEWAHHAPLAAAAGVSVGGLGVVRRERLVGGDGGEEGDGDEEERARKQAAEVGLGDKEWAVLRFADEMTRNVQVSDAVFEALRRVCGEREVVEVTATVAAYNCVSRFLVALDVGERNGTGPDYVASGH
ncbi:AhpD-like protein [Hypoxylon sp. NC1633]|nr:AhpD-like protein [Hypoxylon sp. NC1633]